jgi:hypothetical protein
MKRKGPVQKGHRFLENVDTVKYPTQRTCCFILTSFSCFLLVPEGGLISFIFFHLHMSIYPCQRFQPRLGLKSSTRAYINLSREVYILFTSEFAFPRWRYPKLDDLSVFRPVVGESSCFEDFLFYCFIHLNRSE